MLQLLDKELLVLDLNGHRVHPNPSGFLKEKKAASAAFFSFRNPDQINWVRPVRIGYPVDLR